MSTPNISVVDAHHHLWVQGTDRYLVREIYADIAALAESGVQVESTVFVECRSMYRTTGPEELHPVGEIEFANGVGALGSSGVLGPARLCAGIVGFADLTLGDGVKPVIEKMQAVGGERFRSIRYMTANDPQVKALAPKDIMLDDGFRRGYAALAGAGVRFDAWIYHPQLSQLLSLVRTAPGMPVVINHAGGLIGMGSFGNNREEAFADWRRDLAALAAEPNVFMKLGGFSMPVFALAPEGEPGPDRLAVFAERIRPLVESCVEIFGVERCMFESNFPVLRSVYSYRDTWEVLRLASANFSAAEKAQLFAETAKRFYAIA